MINRAGRLSTCAAVIGLLATACSSNKPNRTVTVTVPAPSSSSAAASAAGSSSAASASSPGAPAHLSKIAGTCETLLPHFDVMSAVGVADVTGKDAFVVGQPEKDIGRIAYLNCRYGVTGAGTRAAPKIEIGVSLYSTPAQAQARITATADDYSAHGATVTDITVSGQPAQALTGGVGTGYTEPLVVAASGQRTVAVSVVASIASGAKAVDAASKVATLALQRTGG